MANIFTKWGSSNASACTIQFKISIEWSWHDYKFTNSNFHYYFYWFAEKTRRMLIDFFIRSLITKFLKSLTQMCVFISLWNAKLQIKVTQYGQISHSPAQIIFILESRVVAIIFSVFMYFVYWLQEIMKYANILIGGSVSIYCVGSYWKSKWSGIENKLKNTAMHNSEPFSNGYFVHSEKRETAVPKLVEAPPGGGMVQ